MHKSCTSNTKYSTQAGISVRTNWPYVVCTLQDIALGILEFHLCVNVLRCTIRVLARVELRCKVRARHAQAGAIGWTPSIPGPALLDHPLNQHVVVHYHLCDRLAAHTYSALHMVWVDIEHFRCWSDPAFMCRSSAAARDLPQSSSTTADARKG